MSHAASHISVTATVPHAKKKHGLALISPPCHHRRTHAAGLEMS